MIDSIHQEAQARGISRLCHFTPIKNFVHIASGDLGILSTKSLRTSEGDPFSQTDQQRWDGREGHICCTIEYPNAWYLDRAKASEIIFDDWIVVLINPRHLWATGTLFCPVNAATQRGSLINQGPDAFRRLFSDKIDSGSRIRNRDRSHLNCCPTDQQAEIMIPDNIPKSDIIGIVVYSESQAKREFSRLRLLGVNVDQFNVFICPTMFEKYALSSYITSGRRPQESPWTPGS